MPFSTPALTERDALSASEDFISHLLPYPGGCEGRGIVIAGGGKYFTSAWIGIKALRASGCTLPIQLWHLGRSEMDQTMKSLVLPLGVECVDAYKIRVKHPARILNGWELKCYAILQSPFKEVLLLDADNLAVVNPEPLFDSIQYQTTGAVFWPDLGRLDPAHPIWNLCGIAYQDEPEFESGQIVVDKEKCWEALNLCMWYNEQSDFYYQYVHGDKETFHLAFRKLDKSYSMPRTSADYDDPVFYQYGFDNELLFQHRKKWNLFEEEPRMNLVHAEECWSYIEELRRLWDGQIRSIEQYIASAHSMAQRRIAETLSRTIFTYERVGHDKRAMAFAPNGVIGLGGAECEVFWNLVEEEGRTYLDIYSDQDLTCRLQKEAANRWRGKWLQAEQMLVRLTPQPIRLSWEEFDEAPASRLRLLTVTLIAVDCVSMERTARVLKHCLRQAQFKNTILFTDARVELPREITRVPIARLPNREAYSEFMLLDLPVYHEMFGDFILVVQHDGFIISTKAWKEEFLHYDYIGAPWKDGQVGNGGFSLRSKKLLEAQRAIRADLVITHPEDEALGRRYRARLEEEGIRFAPAELARQFSIEDAPYAGSFGYHGQRTEQMSGLSIEDIDRKPEIFTGAELFYKAKYQPSDLNEHVETLRRLGSDCAHITEFGTHGGISTAALLYAKPNTLITYDLERHLEVQLLEEAARDMNVEFKFENMDTLKADIQATDLLFIDTYPTYEQIGQELARHAAKVRLYLVFHDTATLGQQGESKGEVGIRSAIREFMESHPQWSQTEHYEHNNGLTVLKKNHE